MSKVLPPRSQLRWVWITAGLAVALAAWLLTERRGAMPATDPVHTDVSGAMPLTSDLALGVPSEDRLEGSSRTGATWTATLSVPGEPSE